MFRQLLRPVIQSAAGLAVKRTVFQNESLLLRQFSQLSIQHQPINLVRNAPVVSNVLLSATTKLAALDQVRTVTKFSLQSGKRKSVKAARKRFFRLDWGMWIRTKAGRFKHLWKKSPKRRYRLRQHVFTNAVQSHLLDKMATSYWRKPKHFVNDPYRTYHQREEMWTTRRKPIEWEL